MRRYARFVPAVLWACLIFYLSSVPSLKSPFGIWDLYLRKAAHITEYAVLTILIAAGAGVKEFKYRLAAALLAAAYAVTDELHQKFVPGRTMAFADMAWDWIGCCLGYLTSSLYAKRAKRQGRRDIL